MFISRRLAVNIVLFVLVLLLALIAYIEPGQDRAGVEQALLLISPQQVTRIIIDKPQAETIVLQRQPAGWHITSPIIALANQSRIETMLRIAAARSHEHFPADQQPLKTFHLHDPLGSVHLNEQQIDFGMVNPLTRQRYVLVAGTVHLINDEYYYRTQLALAALVDPHLVPPGQQLVALELPDAEVVYDGEGGWRRSADAGVQLPAVTQQLTSWLHDWQQARAEQVASDRAEDSIDIQSRLLMRFADGSELVYLIRRDQDGVSLVRPDIGMRYLLAALDKLLTVPDESDLSQPAM